MRAIIAVLLLGVLAPLGAAVGQESGGELTKDEQRMVREGMAEALDSRFRGGRTPAQKHALAMAYTNKARRARRAEDRDRAYEKADESYAAWIAKLENAAVRGGVPDEVRLAAARVEYAGMILSGQAAADLDEYEITAGQRGDREKLEKLLRKAAGQYKKAGEKLTPIMEDLTVYEEDLLAAGLYDTAVQAKLDMTLNVGWTNYYRGVLESKDEAKRRTLLATAERKFVELVDSGQTGQMRYQCYTALAMTQREQGRFEEAEQSFRYAMGEDVDPVVEAQVRYELARCQLNNGKFDEARTTLRPLVEKDPQNLSDEDRPARFYINLAHLWDANSYLIESTAIRREAANSTARAAILSKSQRAREMGLAKLSRLKKRGGAWPALVQIYVAASVNLKTPPKRLSSLELLYTAEVLIDTKGYDDALRRLKMASERDDLDAELAGDVLFELGRCHYLLHQEREAAEVFQKLASEHRSYEKAPRAATFAYGLWGKIAERSGKAEDYLALAAVLRNLLESFANHPRRDEAMWLLPVSLQLAERFEEAADEFGKIPETSTRHWEEAQYRRVVCQRKAVEAGRASLGAEEYSRQAHTVVDALVRYAGEAYGRAESSAKADKLKQWSAEARLAAAEVLISQGVDDHQRALEVVEPFEKQHPESPLEGRILAIRIRAYRGLRQFEQASAILREFLQAASPAQVGATLATLATGMQEEVKRLMEDGQTEAARALAADSVSTFDELEKWVRADEQRAQSLDFVLSGRAKMHYLAGQYGEAHQLVTGLLERSPRNGNYRHLQALILTAQLPEDAPQDTLKTAQDAWAKLLTDPGIRERAPERYWEARYNWLALTLRLGNAADVETAITQERIFRPDLGGAPWKTRLENLLNKALEAQGKSPETQPAESQPATDAATPP